jgi:hypothetical protein
MKGEVTKPTDEPVGIVIAGMQYTPPVTVFAAYVWGPAPAEEEPKAT